MRSSISGYVKEIIWDQDGMVFKTNNSSLVKMKTSGVTVVAQQVKNPTSIHEDGGLIPGLNQWGLRISRCCKLCLGQSCGWNECCCGCGVGLQLQLGFAPSPGTSICCRCCP